MSDYSPTMICALYRQQLWRVYGKEICEASRVDYGRGWFYIGLAKRYSDGSVGNADMFVQAYRKKAVLEMIDNLRKRETRGA